mmetsp:Transcript_13589/g.26848  ORF Transcript_13589/g.26848 Transcript_13589/m.26848 type:complete len:276 (-) Transcript_13589:20-847(-)
MQRQRNRTAVRQRGGVAEGPQQHLHKRVLGVRIVVMCIILAHQSVPEAQRDLVNVEVSNASALNLALDVLIKALDPMKRPPVPEAYNVGVALCMRRNTRPKDNIEPHPFLPLEQISKEYIHPLPELLLMHTPQRTALMVTKVDNQRIPTIVPCKILRLGPKTNHIPRTRFHIPRPHRIKRPAQACLITDTPTLEAPWNRVAERSAAGAGRKVSHQDARVRVAPKLNLSTREALSYVLWVIRGNLARVWQPLEVSRVDQPVSLRAVRLGLVLYRLF